MHNGTETLVGMTCVIDEDNPILHWLSVRLNNSEVVEALEDGDVISLGDFKGVFRFGSWEIGGYYAEDALTKEKRTNSDELRELFKSNLPITVVRRKITSAYTS